MTKVFDLDKVESLLFCPNGYIRSRDIKENSIDFDAVFKLMKYMSVQIQNKEFGIVKIRLEDDKIIIHIGNVVGNFKNPIISFMPSYYLYCTLNLKKSTY